MNGGRHIAKQRGNIPGNGVRSRIKRLIEEKPWLVMKALSTMSEYDRKSLKWIMTKV